MSTSDITKGMLGFIGDFTKSWFVGAHRSSLDDRRHQDQQQTQREMADLGHVRRRAELQLQFELQRRVSEGRTITAPGDWLNGVCPTCPEPFVIFDTYLRQDHSGQETLPFNPLAFLEQEFKRQNREIDSLVTVIGAGQKFRTEEEARLFYQRELAPRSAVIVYGSFLGSRLMIDALFAGIRYDQRVPAANGLVEPPHHINLLDFSRATYDEVLEMSAKSRANSSPKTVIDRHLSNMEALFDFAVNTKLQVLVDHYFQFWPHVPYAPRAATHLERKLARLEGLGLMVTPVVEQLKQHSQFVGAYRNELLEAKRIGEANLGSASLGAQGESPPEVLSLPTAPSTPRRAFDGWLAKVKQFFSRPLEIDTLSLAEALSYFQKDVPAEAASGVLLCESTDGDGTIIWQAFLDNHDALLCRRNGNPYGRKLRVQHLQQDLADAFGEDNVILVR